MFTVLGRYGYNGNGSELAGGINTERLVSKPTNDCKMNHLKEVRNTILQLLKAGEADAAYECLMNCSASEEQKVKFFKKYF